MRLVRFFGQKIEMIVTPVWNNPGMIKEIAFGDGVMVMPELRMSEFDLPDMIRPPVASVYDMKRIAGYANEIWESNYDPDRMTTLLDKIGDTDSVAMEEIGIIRKAGLIVKSVFVLFDETHMAPQIVRQFTNRTGRLKDTSDVAVRQLLTDEIRGYIHNLPSIGITGQMLFVNPETFRDHYDRLVTSVSVTSKLPRLTVSQFHQIRKWTRHIMNLYRLSGSIDPSADTVRTYRFLSDINSTLGKQHDSYRNLQEKLQPTNIVLTTRVDEYIQNKIKIFVDRHSRLPTKSIIYPNVAVDHAVSNPQVLN